MHCRTATRLSSRSLFVSSWRYMDLIIYQKSSNVSCIITRSPASPADMQADASAASAADTSTSYSGNGAGSSQQSSSRPSLNGSGSADGIQMQPSKRALGLYVRVRNMVKHFNTTKGVFKAVDGVDVDVEPSSITALLGPSGEHCLLSGAMRLPCCLPHFW